MSAVAARMFCRGWETSLKRLSCTCWQKIPMNHPDKISVPGSGVKNRYRTIIPSKSAVSPVTVQLIIRR